MKIGILLCANLERAQYLYKYVEILDILKCDYEVIYWNRLLSNYVIQCNGKFIPFDEKIDSYKPLIYKSKKYFKFICFAHHIIKKNNYDKLILFTTPSVISVWDLCLGKYKGKYIFDYRDLTKEYFKPYRKLTQKLICTSEIFITSSPGYLSYFKPEKIKNWILCHNTYGDITFKSNLCLNKKDPIKIVYWGAIRQLEYNKKICDLFGNDKRFKMIYHGDGAYIELTNYCKERDIKNIEFTGGYLLQQIESFAEETDILFNAYETDFVTTPSLSVKVYDSLEYRLPMVVSKKTYMESYLKKYDHVFCFNISDSILDDLYEWYMGLNENIVLGSFEHLKEEISTDEEKFKKIMKEFVNHETYS